MEKKLIDPRSQRWAAGFTSVIALGTFASLVYEQTILGASLAALSLFLFVWSVFFKEVAHPYQIVFVKLIRNKLSQPSELEDPRGPEFAQKIGLLVSLFTFSFAFVSPWAGSIFAAILFIASALNAYLNVCLGCLIYLRLKRIGINL
jgi:hypothetical protein